MKCSTSAATLATRTALPVSLPISIRPLHAVFIHWIRGDSFLTSPDRISKSCKTSAAFSGCSRQISNTDSETPFKCGIILAGRTPDETIWLKLSRILSAIITLPSTLRFSATIWFFDKVGSPVIEQLWNINLSTKGSTPASESFENPDSFVFSSGISSASCSKNSSRCIRMSCSTPRSVDLSMT